MKTRISKKTLKKATPLILRFAIQSLVRIAMSEAIIRGPLTDLKGLVDICDVSDLDMELLNELNDPKFEAILNTCLQIHEHIEKYLLLHNLKEAVCEKDADALKVAMKVYQSFIWDTDQEFEPWHTAWVYVHILGVLDALIQLNTSSFFDFEYGQTFGNFYGAYIHKYANRYPMPPDADTTVTLLYELFQKVEAGYIDL